MLKFALAVGLVLSLGFVPVAQADTEVHGFAIPTAGEGTSQVWRICTTTTTRQWTNRGSSATGVVVCPTPTDNRRPVSTEVLRAVAALGEAITFDWDSDIVSGEANEAIETISTWLSATPGYKLIVSGHADATGPEAYNEALSERRARAVGTFLMMRGIPEERLSIKWFGERELLVDTPESERSNRRVVFSIDD